MNKSAIFRFKEQDNMFEKFNIKTGCPIGTDAYIEKELKLLKRI